MIDWRARTMDRNHQRETEKESTDPVVNSLAQRQPPDVVSLDPDIFITNVINMVNDWTIAGLEDMEEFIAEKLDVKSEDSQRALKQGVDSIYGKVQDNIDESFDQWESICRDRYFNKLLSSPLTARSSQKITGDASKHCSKASSVEDGEEEALDTELGSLRSQLVSARREAAKMRRELTLLEKQLASRRAVLTDVQSLEGSFDGDVLAEVMRSSNLLRDTILKASSSLEKKPRLQTGPQLMGDCLAEMPPEELISDLKLPFHTEIGDPLLVDLLG